MKELKIDEIIKTMRENENLKKGGALFRNASKEDLDILDELEEYMNDDCKNVNSDKANNKIFIPVQIREFYEKHEPCCIPTFGAGINLLNLKQIRKENIYNEPGRYLLKEGYLIIGLTLYGYIICLNLNEINPSVLLGRFDFCRCNKDTKKVEIVYFPKNLIKEENKDTVLKFTKENIEKSLVEIAPSFEMFLKESMEYSIPGNYFKDKEFVYRKELNDDIILESDDVKYKAGVCIYGRSRAFILLNLERNLNHLENCITYGSKKLLEKIDKVLNNKSDLEIHYSESVNFEIKSDFIKITHEDFSYDSNIIGDDYTLKISTEKFKELVEIFINENIEIEEADIPWDFIN